MNTASHAFISVLVDNGVDRVFQVPGESYLGFLDAIDFNPDFVAVARSFGMRAEMVESESGIEAAIARGLAAREPCLIEVRTSLQALLPRPRDGGRP